jgi:hypothetical protein
VHLAGKDTDLAGWCDLAESRSIDQCEFLARMNLVNERIGDFLSQMIDTASMPIGL